MTPGQLLEGATPVQRQAPPAPRICMLALHFAEYTSKLVRALSAHGPVLVVIYADTAVMDFGEDYAPAFAAEGVTLVALPKPRGVADVLRNTRRIVRAVKDFQPTVIHVQEALRDELPLSLPFLPAVPLVLTIHDPEPHSGQEARSFRFSRMRVYRWLVRKRADEAVVHGQVLVGIVEQHWPHLAGHVHVLANGPHGEMPAEAEQRAPDSGQLLFFGRVYEYKGLGHFVRLVKSLHRAGVRMTGVVAGKGPDLAPYRDEMVAAGCFDVRDGHIPVSEVDALFRSCRVVVLPYTDATQSGVASLALGYCKPVVAHAVGAIPELVRDGVNGFLVEAGDAAGLQAAVTRVLNDDALYLHLSAGAKQLRDGELSWRVVAEGCMEIYRGAVERRRDFGL